MINDKKAQKTRPLGDVMLDLEKYLIEMTSPNGHDLQKYEVLSLVNGWLDVHAPQAQEEYADGTKPAFFYGPKKERK